MRSDTILETVFGLGKRDCFLNDHYRDVECAGRLLFRSVFGHRRLLLLFASAVQKYSTRTAAPKKSSEANCPPAARSQAAQRPSAGLSPSTWIGQCWSEKVRPFLVAESEPRNGGRWLDLHKDLYCGLGKRYRFWSRILSPKMVSFFGPAGPQCHHHLTAKGRRVFLPLGRPRGRPGCSADDI